ncbi:gibberellin 2-beta-dioxygenase 8-like [Hevea brasiliensis]|uniref:gibberellin 2-beta-dioxygenase 8-like n=1 Tax=Hevea brasiliensis TaxID=3981 RepID=UPI0025EBF5B5|nr:gibberellin 2-beta-dioxygenase 8-like [Hevea brasiliensis]
MDSAVTVLNAAGGEKKGEDILYSLNKKTGNQLLLQCPKRERKRRSVFIEDEGSKTKIEKVNIKIVCYCSIFFFVLSLPKIPTKDFLFFLNPFSALYLSLLTSFSLLISIQQPVSLDMDPPFREIYKTLLENTIVDESETKTSLVDECELPFIDLGRLSLDESDEKDKCEQEIARASQEWGFFQVVNHGISREILENMRREQVKLFKQPFDKKSKEDKFLNFSSGTYRWGTPTATCLSQLSWSEAFHIPMTDISASNGFTSLSSTIEQFATRVASLAQKLAEILADKLGRKSTFFQENCVPSTCYLRLNRYPPCPIPAEVFGLIPHTDSDFLTILHQDQVGGLQLIKDGKWFAVKPNPEALIINVGDLFQAWSNDVYKSVQHRVVTNPRVERFSTAYFFCPSYDTEIESGCEPSVYEKFSFKEYREQVQKDVQLLGRKVGLPRFVL